NSPFGDESWTVSLWRSDDAVFDAGDTNVGDYEVTTLGIGASATDTVTFNAPAAGAYTLFGFADSGDEVTEDLEVNNMSIVGTLLVDSDLTVTAAADVYEALSGVAVDVDIQVNNIGDADAETDVNPGVDTWTVSLWRSADGAFDRVEDTQIGSYEVTTLDAGANTTDTITFNAPAAGAYTLFGFVDSVDEADGEVTEADEDNNTSIVGTLLVDSDLTVTAAADVYEALSGVAVDVDIQVNNIGDAAAETDVNPGVGTWTVSLWRSDDAVFDRVEDTQIGSYE
ncbi:unnamed protein product, partial [marine sediment metagenome]